MKGTRKTQSPGRVKTGNRWEEEGSDPIQQAKAYYSFLKKIACSLGLGEKEASALAEDSIAAAGKYFADQNDGLTMRLWLSKHFIRNCIFRISSKLFGQKGNAGAVYVETGCFIPLSIRHLSLGFRTVYVLVNYLGFTESEVAILLNNTRLQVKQRLVKAQWKIVESSRHNYPFGSADLGFR